MQKWMEMQDINLRDYLSVIVKHKRIFLIVFFILFFLASSVFLKPAISAPKLSKISMFFDLGIAGLSPTGQDINLDSKTNVRTKIHNKIFYWQIEKFNINGASLNFDVFMPENTYLVGVSTIQNESQIESGKKLLRGLFESLSDDFTKRILIEKEQLNNQILDMERDVAVSENKVELLHKKDEIFKKREENILKTIQIMNDNLAKLTKLRDDLLIPKEEQINSGLALFYLTSKQQTCYYVHNLNAQLIDIKTEKDEAFTKIDNLQKQISIVKERIKGKESEKNRIRNIQMVQEPKVERYYRKTNFIQKFINIIFLSMIGGIFVVFFVEFLKNLKVRKKDNDTQN